MQNYLTSRGAVRLELFTTMIHFVIVWVIEPCSVTTTISEYLAASVFRVIFLNIGILLHHYTVS
jgi:hypothetical protein